MNFYSCDMDDLFLIQSHKENKVQGAPKREVDIDFILERPSRNLNYFLTQMLADLK
jgi:hypothetical protein